MPSYSRSTTIRRPPDVVFDFLSDLRSELRWNPDAITVEKLTDGEIGPGTRFLAKWRQTRPTEVEILSFDRPRSWTTRSAALGMTIDTLAVVSPHADGVLYTVTIRASASGLASLVAPLALRMMQRGEARNMALIRAALESSS